MHEYIHTAPHAHEKLMHIIQKLKHILQFSLEMPAKEFCYSYSNYHAHALCQMSHNAATDVKPVDTIEVARFY